MVRMSTCTQLDIAAAPQLSLFLSLFFCVLVPCAILYRIIVLAIRDAAPAKLDNNP